MDQVRQCQSASDGMLQRVGQLLGGPVPAGFLDDFKVRSADAFKAGLQPVAGVPAGERDELLQTVAALPADVSVLLIEHDMDLVFSFARRMTVLVNGTVLTEGEPEVIANDPQVKAVYLGHGDAHG